MISLGTGARVGVLVISVTMGEKMAPRFAKGCNDEAIFTRLNHTMKIELLIKVTKERFAITK